ncbi:uncharacterized protein LTR77_004854 [Saxophila tyrrhenica]|uniref:SGNH hydrolase-type esterase domain-containing protein n=1 Tax=Saxophila tyrrhenica TaxID=1690608 RepID=A0AAV9PEE0_9PEZI|nr:hypothetical protein LTR77_004854 [Saxophila tyrrhenica]
MSQRLRITSLGSSFAAGPGIGSMENEAAGRSSQNYAHQLARALNADLTDLSVSGATLLNVLKEEQFAGGCVFEPQLHQIPHDTNIVTLTCGGNDIDYIGSLIDKLMLSQLGPRHQQVLASPKKSLTSWQALAERLEAVLDQIHAVAPKARIYMVQYPAIIGNQTRPLYDLALGPENVVKWDLMAQRLAHSYVDVEKSRSAWVEVVPVAGVSREHGLGSAEPWVRGFSVDMLAHGPAPLHPNLAGHTAVADMLYRQISTGAGLSKL